MTEKIRPPHTADHDDHHHQHQAAQQEHLLWKEAAGQWRQEYKQAALDFVRRTRPELALDDFEVALDKHETAMDVAVSIHEQALERHEKALELEERGARGASKDFDELHHELDCRHAASREAHQLLESRHRAIIEALSPPDD